MGVLTGAVVISAELDPDALEAAQESADFHGAMVVMVANAGTVDPGLLRDDVTLLERPGTEDDEAVDEAVVVAADDADFGAFVAEYAIRLDRGESPATAFSAALEASAWEPSLD